MSLSDNNLAGKTFARKTFAKRIELAEKVLAISGILLMLSGCVYEPYPGPPPPPAPYAYAPAPGAYYAPGSYYYPEYPPVGVELGIGGGGYGRRWR